MAEPSPLAQHSRKGRERCLSVTLQLAAALSKGQFSSVGTVAREDQGCSAGAGNRVWYCC